MLVGRDHNEDTFHISDNGKMLIVADGMGGHKAGEVASALAVEALVDFFVGRGQGVVEAGTGQIETLLREAFTTAHRKVLKQVAIGSSAAVWAPHSS